MNDKNLTPQSQIIEIAKLIYEKNYNTAADGNLSIRLSEDTFLITPSGAHKAFLEPDDLVTMNLNGTQLAGHRKASSEFRLHTTIYKNKPDINAVIHLHSPAALAANLAGIDLFNISYITAPPFPTTQYARAASEQTAELIIPLLDKYNIALIPRHGSVAWAHDLITAFIHIENLEHTSKILLMAKAASPSITPLSEQHRNELLSLYFKK